MTIEELKNKYINYKKTLGYYNYALVIMSFDEVTDCPKLNKERSLDVQDYFQMKITDIITSDDYKDLINNLYQNNSKLDNLLKLQIENEYKQLNKLTKIPKDELYKHYKNLSQSSYDWAIARDTLDYSKFLTDLEELISYNKKYISWQETSNIKGYDVLLDDMEKGYNQVKYDKFFDLIEKELVPFIKEILKCKKPYNEKLDNLKFDIDRQKKLTEIIANDMEYTKDVGCIRETIHPFTTWTNNHDVRITTSYSEDLLLSNLYSVMHEIGHALFQLQMDDKYNNTNIFDSVSCISHESQSRFYENYLGRSKGFVKYLYKVLKELYKEEFNDITFTDLYNYINKVDAQYYRTEADELTYPIHVLIRYKIEKMLFNNEIEAKDMESIFNKLMKEYLGITPPNMKDGVFQDSHWSSGFGYFPTYAIGSAYGAQFIEALKQDIDYEKELESGNFKSINLWLKEHIHKYSSLYKNDEIIKNVCHCEFDPVKYISYLKDKFTEIYLKK